MFDVIFSRTVGKLSAALGFAGLVFCLGFTGYWSLRIPGPTVTVENCKRELSALATTDESGTSRTAAAAPQADAAGILRVAGLWPEETTINRRVCLAVAGVASKAGAPPQTGGNGPRPVDLTLFLNGRRATQMTFKAQPTSDMQYLIYHLAVPTDAAAAGAVFWRELLAGSTDTGVKELTVGLSRTASDNPEAEAATPLKLRIFYPGVFGVGAAAIIMLALAFCVLARYSTLLRDNDKTRLEVDPDFATALTDARANEQAARAASANAPNDPALKNAYAAAAKTAAELTAKAREPAGRYSLGRSQIALWLVLTIAGYIFIWLTLGQFLNVMTAAVLVLLGINGVTGLAAAQMNDAADKSSMTQSFFADILQDGQGPKLHRIQVVAWTVILGIIFIWNAVVGFTFVAFDTNLLLLMGIANSMYVGFKYTEQPVA